MQVQQKQVLEAFQRVQDFLAKNPVPEPGTYGEAATTIDDVVAQLTDHSTESAIGRRLVKADMESEGTLRRELLTQLRPIAAIARATLRGSPGIDAALKSPVGNEPTVTLLNESRAIVKAATPYVDTFVKNGMPADFISQLEDVMSRLQAAFSSKARNVGKRTGSKLGLRNEIKRGFRAVAILDAVITKLYASKPAILGAWMNARRVRGVPGTRKPKVQSAAAPAPAAPPAATPTTEHAA